MKGNKGRMKGMEKIMMKENKGRTNRWIGRKEKGGWRNEINIKKDRKKT